MQLNIPVVAAALLLIATMIPTSAVASATPLRIRNYETHVCGGRFNTSLAPQRMCLNDQRRNTSQILTCANLPDRLAVTLAVWNDSTCVIKKLADTAAECGACLADSDRPGKFLRISGCSLSRQSFTLERDCDAACRSCGSRMGLNTSTCIKALYSQTWYTALAVVPGSSVVRFTQYNSPDCKGLASTFEVPTFQCLGGVVFECDSPNATTTTVAPKPPAPTVTPKPSSGTLVQLACQDSMCSQSCDKGVFPLGQCLPMSAGSAVATCRGGFVHLKIFSNSTMCTGMATDSKMPTDQCLPSSAGGYLENFCLTHSVKPQAQAVLHRSI